MIRVILAILVLQLFSCDGGKKSNKEIISSSKKNIQSINILTLSEPQNEYMEALISGTLVADSNGCIRIKDHIIIWPYGYKLDKNKNAICNSKGDIMIEIGSLVQLSGGERSSFSQDEFRKNIKSNSVNNCQGKYWIVGEEVKKK